MSVHGLLQRLKRTGQPMISLSPPRYHPSSMYPSTCMHVAHTADAPRSEDRGASDRFQYKEARSSSSSLHPPFLLSSSFLSFSVFHHDISACFVVVVINQTLTGVWHMAPCISSSVLLYSYTHTDTSTDTTTTILLGDYSTSSSRRAKKAEQLYRRAASSKA